MLTWKVQVQPRKQKGSPMQLLHLQEVLKTIWNGKSKEMAGKRVLGVALIYTFTKMLLGLADCDETVLG